MTIVTLTAVLFTITALLHLYMPVQFGNNRVTQGIVLFGVIYLLFGILFFTNPATSIRVAALIVTLIGSIGATIQLNAIPKMRNWIIAFILIDEVIILLIILGLLVAATQR